jgi:3-oxoadipate enol-lactonase
MRLGALGEARRCEKGIDMPKVRVNGVELNYIEAGSGDPLLLIMGFGGDHLAWAFQTPMFAQQYRVIAFDNRGVGQSDVPDVPYTTRMMADDAAGLLEAIGIERAHVLGVSMGGMIAQELALNHPRRVRSLQLHCTLARPDRYMHTLIEGWRTVRGKATVEEWMRVVALWLFSPRTYAERPELVESIIQTAIANPYPFTLTGFLRQGDAVRSHDTLDRLGKLTCPTLVSVADDDILVPPRFSRELAAAIQGATLRTVEGAGHCYFWERPDVFNAMCLDFLTRRSTV